MLEQGAAEQDQSTMNGIHSPCTTPIVFVVDDDISVRESLEALIHYAGWQAETFASAQDASPRALARSCLVLDVSLPDLNGLDLQKRVAGDQVNVPIIFITGCGDVPMTVKAMRAGAVEFLTKPFSDDALLGAIRDAIARSQAALSHEAEIRALRDRYASLSRREREVMALVVSGLLNKQVGAELGISEIRAGRARARHGRLRRIQAGERLGGNRLVGPSGGSRRRACRSRAGSPRMGFRASMSYTVKDLRILADLRHAR